MLVFDDELKDAIFLLRTQKVLLKDVESSSAKTFFIQGVFLSKSAI